MKSITQLQSVINALAQVQTQKSISHDNGTMGKTYLCHFWDSEEVADKLRNAKELEITKAALNGNASLVIKLKEELSILPPAKINVLFKLLTPIKLNGTKIAYADGKTYQPKMDKVSIIHVSQDAVGMELLDFEETPDMVEDRRGNPVPIIKLTVTNGIIDVKEAIMDRRDKTKEIVPARASVFPISLRSMQIAGKILGQEENAKAKTYGMTEIL